MTCTDCGADLTDVPVAQDCPECGGSRRHATVISQAARIAIGAAPGLVVIEFSGPRAWRQKWDDVRYRLGMIESIYAGQSTNADSRRVVEDFFGDCRILADWLTHDAGVDAITYVHNDPDLKICDGIAQTTKHHTRNNPNAQITAAVWRIYSGTRVEIDWSLAGGSTKTEDARDLARRCVAAWLHFLTQHGL